jgi:hypothetical protein
MKVFVDWDTDGYSVEELGLSTIVDMPTLNEEDIADYLSDEYGYCVNSQLQFLLSTSTRFGVVPFNGTTLVLIMFSSQGFENLIFIIVSYCSTMQR